MRRVRDEPRIVHVHTLEYEGRHIDVLGVIVHEEAADHVRDVIIHEGTIEDILRVVPSDEAQICVLGSECLITEVYILIARSLMHETLELDTAEQLRKIHKKRLRRIKFPSMYRRRIIGSRTDELPDTLSPTRIARYHTLSPIQAKRSPAPKLHDELTEGSMLAFFLDDVFVVSE
jgi:hypothetical protein